MVGSINLNPFSAAAPSVTTEIAELRIYPVKSCRGISVDSAVMTQFGLDLDRKWMFIDTSKENKFVTIRQISEMTLLDTAIVTGADVPGAQSEDEIFLRISVRGTDSRVEVPAYPTEEWLQENTTLQTVNIWGTDTDGHVYNDKYNSIFAEFLKSPIALVHKGPTPRPMWSNGAPEHLGREQPVNFPDQMSVLIANTASIRELNTRLEKKGVDQITIERFRPNIIVRGAADDTPTSKELDPHPAAWVEDNWKRVRIVTENEEPAKSTGVLGSLWPFSTSNSIDLDVQAHCARCDVPNVNPDTAFKHKHEPWDTLVSYRRIDEGMKWKPCFGVLSVPRNEGKISVGMKFEVLETTTKHKIIR